MLYKDMVDRYIPSMQNGAGSFCQDFKIPVGNANGTFPYLYRFTVMFENSSLKLHCILFTGLLVLQFCYNTPP